MALFYVSILVLAKTSIHPQVFLQSPKRSRVGSVNLPNPRSNKTPAQNRSLVKSYYIAEEELYAFSPHTSIVCTRVVFASVFSGYVALSVLPFKVVSTRLGSHRIYSPVEINYVTRHIPRRTKAEEQETV